MPFIFVVFGAIPPDQMAKILVSASAVRTVPHLAASPSFPNSLAYTVFATMFRNGSKVAGESA